MDTSAAAQAFADNLADITPQLIGGLVIFLVFYLLALVAGAVLRNIAGRHVSTRDLAGLFGRIAKFSLILVGLITALGTIGINVSAMVAGLGLTGFALGFALKDIVSNFLSGLLVIIYRPIKRGDLIEVAGMQGKVIEIDLRYTTLQGEKDKVLLPNATLFASPIKILAGPTDRQLDAEK